MPELCYCATFEDISDLARLSTLAVPEQCVGFGLQDVAEDLAITALLKRKAGALSAGQKTRVALAKAMLNRPEVLLLDEPTASLDPDTGDWVRAYLERYRDREGAAILLASHNMGEVERLCSEVPCGSGRDAGWGRRA